MQFKLEELMASDAQLLGRTTYEGFAEAWPTMEGTGAFGEKMNEMPKFVASNTLESPEWTNTTVLDGDLAQEVEALKDRYDGDILVGGSAQLVQSLLELDLVDELRLMVFPIVLGKGKRLFGEHQRDQGARAGRRRGRSRTGCRCTPTDRRATARSLNRRRRWRRARGKRLARRQGCDRSPGGSRASSGRARLRDRSGLARSRSGEARGPARDKLAARAARHRCRRALRPLSRPARLRRARAGRTRPSAARPRPGRGTRSRP